MAYDHVKLQLPVNAFSNDYVQIYLWDKFMKKILKNSSNIVFVSNKIFLFVRNN